MAKKMTVDVLAQKLDDHLLFINTQVNSIMGDVKEIKNHLKDQNSKVFKNMEFRERHLKWHESAKIERNEDMKRAITITGILVTVLFSVVNIVLHFLNL